MKTTKRLVSIVLCLLMIAAIGVPAFAVVPGGNSAQPNGIAHPLDNTWVALNHDGVHFRKQPSLYSDLYDTLYSGTYVYIVKYEYTYSPGIYWAQVQYGGHTGYIDNSLLV